MAVEKTIKGSDDPSSTARSIARHLRFLGNGELADLRRLEKNRLPAAYWLLASRHDSLLSKHEHWGPIVKALALLTTKASPGERKDLHDPQRRLGTALCDGGSLVWPVKTTDDQIADDPFFSENRLAQLLASRGVQRTTLMIRAIRSLAIKREPMAGLRTDDVAWSFLMEDISELIAGPYYKRLDRLPERSEEATENTNNV